MKKEAQEQAALNDTLTAEISKIKEYGLARFNNEVMGDKLKKKDEYIAIMVEQGNASNEAEELKAMKEQQENDRKMIEALQERVARLEKENSEKDDEISRLRGVDEESSSARIDLKQRVTELQQQLKETLDEAKKRQEKHKEAQKLLKDNDDGLKRRVEELEREIEHLKVVVIEEEVHKVTQIEQLKAVAIVEEVHKVTQQQIGEELLIQGLNYNESEEKSQDLSPLLVEDSVLIQIFRMFSK